jgi:carbamate kinase
MEDFPKRVVVAFGGNAITGADDTGEIHEQFYHTRVAVRGIGPLLRSDAGLVITHGNGPQVGTALARMEIARGVMPARPLGVLVADTQGGIGYMLAQVIDNWLMLEGNPRPVTALVTQVVVDQDDPALHKPTKPVGMPLSEEEAARFRAHGWRVTGSAESGYRRLVSSPHPVRIVEAPAIKALVDQGQIVIACGGGGVPVTETEHGLLDGIDAVIDKDRASALLATEIEADYMVILTAVERVALGFGTPQAQELPLLTVREAQSYLKQGEFPPGSMGPKIEGAIDFLRHGGKEVLITSFTALHRAWKGETGTRIVPDEMLNGG